VLRARHDRRVAFGRLLRPKKGTRSGQVSPPLKARAEPGVLRTASGVRRYGCRRDSIDPRTGSNSEDKPALAPMVLPAYGLLHGYAGAQLPLIGMNERPVVLAATELTRRLP
jgi:hypothetical protein